MVFPVLRFPDRPGLRLDVPRIVGAMNVTPDSFWEGGRFTRVEAAVARARSMAAAGAAVIDVGGESTRPGAARVSAAEQIDRVVPVIQAVRAMLDREFEKVAVSVDTTRVAVAEAALEAGASMLNDVSAGREDGDETDGRISGACGTSGACGGGGMLGLAASRGVPIVLMHMLGEPAGMQESPRYEDVVSEVSGFLNERAALAEAAGVAAGNVVVDPGIGFGKTLEHNLALLAALPAMVREQRAQGRAVMLGVSRKSMFGQIDPAWATPADRLPATLATTALAAAAGVGLIRVHDVAENVQAAAVAYRITQAGLSGV